MPLLAEKVTFAWDLFQLESIFLKIEELEEWIAGGKKNNRFININAGFDPERLISLSQHNIGVEHCCGRR